jgi:hypothetical protein
MNQPRQVSACEMHNAAEHTGCLTAEFLIEVAEDVQRFPALV